MGFQSNGGSYVPAANYDRTGATDLNATFLNAVNNSNPLVVSASTFTPSPSVHDNRVISLQNAAGATVTLPPATGSGAHYQFLIGITLTSGTLVIKVANSSDYMRGQAWTVAAAQAGFLTANTGTVATESDTITFNRTTTGLGTLGDYVELIDQQPNVWAIEADYASSGTAATPFSSTV